MRRKAMLVAALVLVAASPAWAADEDDPTVPRTSGPLVTIPVDREAIEDMVVNDVVVEPATDLTPGERVRLIARLGVASAPPRTFLLLDGDQEITGDVLVGDEGSIDHVFVLPTSIAAGDYTLTLVAEGLGTASLGTLEVVAVAPEPAVEAPAEATAPAEQVTTTTAPPHRDPAGVAEDDVAAPTGGVTPPVRSRVGVSLAIGAALLLIIVLVMLTLERRRRSSVATFAQSATLPSATVELSRRPEDAGSPDTHHAAEEGETGADPPSTAAAPPPAGTYHLVELRAAVDADDQPADETLLGEFSDLDAAKAEARLRHQANDADRSAEHWWEVRTDGRDAVWILHSWAAREYDLDDTSRAAHRSQRGAP